MLLYLTSPVPWPKKSCSWPQLQNYSQLAESDAGRPRTAYIPTVVFVVFSFSIQMAVVKKKFYMEKVDEKSWVFCVCPFYYFRLIAFLTSLFLLMYCFALATAYLSDSLTNKFHCWFNMPNQLLHAVLTAMGCQSITCKLLSTCNYCVTCVKINAFFIMCYPWGKRRVSSFQALLLSVMF